MPTIKELLLKSEHKGFTKEQLDQTAKEMSAEHQNDAQAVYNMGRGQHFSAEQVGIDEYLASPCYRKIGFDPFNPSLKEEYRLCEEQYYKDLYFDWAIYGITIIVIAVVLALTVRKALQYWKIKQIENFPEVSKEFSRKYRALKDLLKAKAISLKEYRKKLKAYIQDADLMIQKRTFEIRLEKLKEAFDSGVISESDYTRAVNSLKGFSAKSWKPKKLK